ncbi:M23 family metallopeptidase [Vibrio cholerae]|uniref:M23 family metallopeptidase n=1 Tax=Vibrio cholerae TaxID=666 RepID=UPI00053C0916|nr:M23 family metallopeptidase [Vibrio cholerae]
MVILLQFVIPLALIAWLAFSPGNSIAGRWLKSLGIGLVLFTSSLLVQWIIWWLPLLNGVIWLLIVIFHFLYRPQSGILLTPAKLKGWVEIILSVILMCLGGFYGLMALEGRELPDIGVVDIANPFGKGKFLVASGGSNLLVNAHVRTLDSTVERYSAWRGQSYAIDFIGIGPLGFKANSWSPTDPSDYVIFGTEILAPCNGKVKAAENNMPDFDIPQKDLVNRLGNHVILFCDGFEIVLAHMRHNSVIVAIGDEVAVGSKLGEVGNSGASTEPHLHIHAQRSPKDRGSMISGEPLALRIEGRFLVRGDRLKGVSN